jgi:hypothetical protein
LKVFILLSFREIELSSYPKSYPCLSKRGAILRDDSKKVKEHREIKTAFFEAEN